MSVVTETREKVLAVGSGMRVLCGLLLLAGGPLGTAGAEVLRREPLLGMPAPAEDPGAPAPAESREVSLPVAAPVMPDALVAPPVAPLVAPASAPALPTMRITDLDLADVVDIVTLLRLMARLADVNMLISPRVEGSIGFSFHGVPWDEAFRSIIASAGLTYAWQGEVLRVMTIDDVRRELEIETLVKDRESVREELRRVEPMMLRVIPLRYLVAENVEKTITRMLTGGDGTAEVTLRRKATVSADAESNSIIIHAVPDEVEKVTSLIAALDQPRPLIQIEARIVEAARDTARQLGMQWGGQTSRMRGSRIVTAGGPGAESGFVSDFPAQFSTGTETAGGFTLGMMSERIGMNELLNLQLTALQRQGHIKIQASPTVTTLDNETAVIESGEERAYRVSTGTGNVLDVSLEWKKAVLKLEVTPHVVDGRLLRVEIVAHKDSFDETKPQTNNEFPVSTKRARTTVLLADGETTMIGGFSLESSSKAATGVPGLMRIPLLGRLFRSDSTAGRFDETIIFITPTIL